MGFLSNKIRMKKLNAGDHIYSWRNGYSYSHHGIYVGDGKVIHLTRAAGHLISKMSRKTFPFNPLREDPVECCSIEKFLSDRGLRRYKYGVKTALFLIKRGGTCTLDTSDPPEEVVRRAYTRLENGFGNYHLFHNNCEDFAIFCKTGVKKIKKKSEHGRSGQINFLRAASFVLALTPYHLKVSAFRSILALVGIGLVYCFVRLSGVDRDEVGKVPVEEFDFNGSRRRSSIPWYYFAMAIWEFIYWYWTPACRIFSWLYGYLILYLILVLFCILYLIFIEFVGKKNL